MSKRVSDIEIIRECEKRHLIYIGRFIKDNGTWIYYVCQKHMNKGIQFCSFHNLKYSKYGCRFCAGKSLSTQDFAERLKETVPDVLVVGEYRGANYPLECRCTKCGHQWDANVRSLLNKSGCPMCTFSKGEQKIARILQQNNIDYYSQYQYNDCCDIHPLRFDYYLPEYNACLEYQGQQHYYPVRFGSRSVEEANIQFQQTVKRDKIKEQYCTDNHINLIQIPYWEYDKLEEYIFSRL